METDPVIGDVWRQGDVTIRVNRITEGDVWVTWEKGERHAFKRIPISAFREQIVGAEYVGQWKARSALEYPEFTVGERESL